jgi:membrane associated rhomboid family serine protease
MGRRITLVIVMVVAVLVVAFTDVPAAYVFAPLLGAGILWFGIGSLMSLQAGAAHVPDGDPAPVDPTVERTTYWCAGCGAELLLLVRGTQSPPRHCGERMRERVEIVGERLTGDR